jgi:hypothetical protein
MKTPFSRLISASHLAAFTAWFLSLSQPFEAQAAAPSWWKQRGVLDANQPQNDYAAVNTGQLKHIAKQAMLELDAKLPGGAGTTIQQMVTSWSTVTPDRNDFAAINVGQLKAVAKPFYDRLNEAGYQQSYPWSNSITNRNDFAQVNIGQLKSAFAICVSCPSAEDTDNDGVPDWWETQFFGSLTAVSNSSDHDGDGLSDLWENIFQTNPLNRDTDGDGLSDGHEVVTLSALGFSPTNAHTKNPTLTDSVWAASQDSDADGMNDRYEVANNLNHLDSTDALIDQDGDTLTALQEFNVGSAPWNNDTDYDGLLDQEDGVASAMSNDPFNGQYDWSQDVGADGRTSTYSYSISHSSLGDGWIHSQTTINGYNLLPPPAPLDTLDVVLVPFASQFWSPRLRTAYFYYPGGGVDDPPFTYQGRWVGSKIIADTETGDGNPKWSIGPPYDGTNPDAEPTPPSPKDLNPVRIMQHPVTATSGAGTPPKANAPIRFCRWLEAYPNGQRDNQFADKDRDRFQISIPGVIPNLTKMKIKATDLQGAVIAGGFQNKTTDGNYEVDMKEVGGAMVSEPILLVSDGDDDITFNGKGTDNGKNDQTLLADFGSKIIVTFPELGNGETTFQAQQPVGTITLDMVYCHPKAEGGPPVNMPGDMIPLMERQAQKMREIYRQVGIKVDGFSISLITFPDTWVQDNGTSDPAKNLNLFETNGLMALVESSLTPSKRVRVGFVDAALTSLVTLESGETVAAQVSGKAKAIGSDPCLVSIDAFSRLFLNILAHEVGHASTLRHNYPTRDHRLMRESAHEKWSDDSMAAKRFMSDDADYIKENSSHYVPAQ